MASIGHVAVGMLAGRLHGARDSRDLMRTMSAYAGLSLLPDLDILPVALGQPDHGLLGHRGFTHTWVFAGLVAALAYWIFRRGRYPVRVAVLSFLVVASHGVLDAATTDSRGIALLWPLLPERITLPLRPIPVAPSGLAYLSARGLEVSLVEALYFLPLMLLALWKGPLRSFLKSRHPVFARVQVFLIATAFCLVLGQIWLAHSELVAKTWAPRARASPAGSAAAALEPDPRPGPDR
ncbi:MAG: metal-dependent hydrolase [Myxococcales bacterium]|nr:metal-dependent hydrolase [Myxococcales bacterium]